MSSNEKQKRQNWFANDNNVPLSSDLACSGTEAGGVGHPHHAPHIGRGQPALLVVVGPGQLPAILLEWLCH